MSTNLLLQPQPISTLSAHRAIGDEWNDSLTGDFLWSNVNISEAMPDVMTPLTWFLCRNAFAAWVPEGQQAVDRLGLFLREHLGRSAAGVAQSGE